MNEDHSDEAEEFLRHLETVRIAFSTPEVFARPDDSAVARVHSHVSRRLDSLEESEVYFRTVHSGFETPAQQPLEAGALCDSATDLQQGFLQLSLFADHPEVVVDLRHHTMSASMLDLLGAIILEETDVREKSLVADVVGLLRRDGAPVNEVVDLALAAFDTILDNAVALQCPLWEAHARYLSIASHR
jgi:hypothetical protein